MLDFSGQKPEECDLSPAGRREVSMAMARRAECPLTPGQLEALEMRHSHMQDVKHSVNMLSFTMEVGAKEASC